MLPTAPRRKEAAQAARPICPHHVAAMGRGTMMADTNLLVHIHLQTGRQGPGPNPTLGPTQPLKRTNMLLSRLRAKMTRGCAIRGFLAVKESIAVGERQ